MHIHGKQNGKIEPYFLQIQHIWRNQFRFEQTPWSHHTTAVKASRILIKIQ